MALSAVDIALDGIRRQEAFFSGCDEYSTVQDLHTEGTLLL